MSEKTMKTLTREEVDKNNFFLSVINGTLFRAGFEYVNAYTIISVFIHTLTGSVALAGLSQFIQTFFSQLGRVMTAPKIHTIKSQPAYMGKVNLAGRFMWLVLALVLLFDVKADILIPCIFVIIAVSWYMGGIMWPIFDDHFARTILPRRRGELLGARELGGGIAAFAGSFVVKLVLGSDMAFNEKYGILYLLGFIFLISSGIPLFAMKDINHKVDDNPMRLSYIIKNIMIIIKEDRNYRWYLIMRCIWIVTDSALLLSLIAVKEAGGLSDLTVSYLLIAQITGRIGGGVMWGQIAKRKGSRDAIIIIQVCNILMSLAMIAIVSGTGVSNFIYIAISFVAGVITPAVLMNFVYFSETTHMTKRPVFMTVEGLISMPLSFVSYLFGIIAEHFGFVPIYVCLIAGSVSILAIAVFKLLKRYEIDQNN